jgi:NTP pyrophosphatase (non-canonical NTP hydrolase)
MCKTINQRLSENINFTNSIEVLYKTKSKKKVFKKACEELAELLEKLLKYQNNAAKVSDEDIAEEIVDVCMHMELIQKYFDSPLFKGLVAGKVTKMANSNDFKRYLNAYTESGQLNNNSHMQAQIGAGFIPYEIGDKVKLKEGRTIYTIDDIKIIQTIKQKTVEFEVKILEFNIWINPNRIGEIVK